MRKRIFSVFLTLCMVCTLLPAQLTFAAWTGSWNGSWYGTWDGQAAELSDNIGFNYGVGGHLLVTMPTTTSSCYTFGTTSSDGLTITETAANTDTLPNSGWNWAVKKDSDQGGFPTYTLILSGANITSKSGDAVMIGKSSGNDKVMNLNLVIKGNNEVTAPTTAIAIYNNKRVTVSGNGSLTVNGGSFGLFADLTDALEIGDQVKLNATGGTGAGLQALKGTLTISTRGEGQAVTRSDTKDARAIKAKTIVIDPNVELYEGTIGSYDNWGESIKAADSPAKWRRKYNLATDSDSYILPAAQVGYGAQSPVTVTISNGDNKVATGELLLQFENGGASNFELNKTTISDIAESGNTTVEVTPKTGLAVGTYTDALQIKADGRIVKEIPLNFSVTQQLTYTITATAGVGGSISPAGNTEVNKGSDQSYSITPNSGYATEDVKVDGVSKGALSSYTFDGVQANHTIEATFSVVPQPTYTITATAGVGGSISPAGNTEVNKGENQIYSVTPNSGFATEDVKVDGVSKGALSSYTFSDVKANHTIAVTFKAISSGGSSSGGGGGGGSTYTPSYTVTTDTSKTEHGQLVLEKGKATAGEIVKLTPKAEAGYEIDTLVVKDEKGNIIEVTKNADGTYSFKMPSGNVTVETYFKESQKKPVVPPTNEQPVTWVNTFNDVAETNWYYDAVKFVNDKNLFEGNSENSFAPKQLLTRAMVWTVIGRLEGAELSGINVFEDARTWAIKSEISDASNPSGNVPREQFVTMLWKYCGSPKANAMLVGFNDTNEIDDYAKEAMAWAVEEGIIIGKGNGLLAPNDNVTRAEAATILMAYYKKYENKKHSS